MSDAAHRAGANLACYGSMEPLPERVPVRAGPFTAILEGADLRYVALNGELVVTRLYAAVRDQSWGTIAPVFTAYALQQGDDWFSLEFAATHQSDGEQGVDFAWTGTVAGTAAGVISCSMAGAARSEFKRNRIGWCVLHPMEAAGQPATVDHGASVTETAFPELISPHQPFVDIVSLTHQTAGGQAVRFDFAGDLFENEDQRNWTDASFKTYSTPLRIPYPVKLAAGEVVDQQVTLTAVRQVPPVETNGGAGIDIAVEAVASGPLPPIGLVTPGHGTPMTSAEQVRFRALNLGHLHHVVDLRRSDWAERLGHVATDAAAIGGMLELETLVGEDDGLNDLFASLASLPAPVKRVSVFAGNDVTSTNDVLARARAARTAADSEVPIGGGSRAYFTQLNRNVPDQTLLDFVVYGSNPQVHAFDNAAIVETLPAQAVTVATAKALLPDLPVVVGPVTLKPRINPDAVPTTSKPAPDALPATVDPRQVSLFGAGWTALSIRYLAEAGVAALTYYETTGWRGIVERSGHELKVPAFPSRPDIVFPMFHVFADLGELDSPQLARVSSVDPLSVDALALIGGSRVRVIVANFTGDVRSVPVQLPEGEARWRVLDETTFEQAIQEPAAFRARWTPLAINSGSATLLLAPFAVATIDIDVIAD